MPDLPITVFSQFSLESPNFERLIRVRITIPALIFHLVFPEFNTGTLAYKRSPGMDNVIRDWLDLYRSFLENHPGKKINDPPF